MVALEKMGFVHIYRKLIKAFLNSKSFAMLVKGSPTTTFHTKRAVRQGDPLLPLLFITVLEILSWKIQQVQLSEIELYNQGETMVESYLAYEDNTLLQTNAKVFRCSQTHS